MLEVKHVNEAKTLFDLQPEVGSYVDCWNNSHKGTLFLIQDNWKSWGGVGCPWWVPHGTEVTPVKKPVREAKYKDPAKTRYIPTNKVLQMEPVREVERHTKRRGYTRFSESFRRKVCKTAIILGDMKEASDRHKVCQTSVWNWLKTYGYANDFVQTKYKKRGLEVTSTPYDVPANKGYPDQMRLAAAMYAVDYSPQAAANRYGVSLSSVYYWIHNYNLSRAYANK